MIFITVENGVKHHTINQYTLLTLRYNPLPNYKILDMTKLKAFADHKIKCNPNIEILDGKSREHCWNRGKCCLPTFSPFPIVFSKAFSFIRIVKNQDRVVKSYPITTQWHLLPRLEKKSFQNIAGKGENTGNQHFLLFPQCFLLYHRQKLSFMLHYLFCHLQFGQGQILSSGNGLKCGTGMWPNIVENSIQTNLKWCAEMIDKHISMFIAMKFTGIGCIEKILAK